MIEQNKIYLTNFSLLLIVLQVALMIYVTIGLDILVLSEFYVKLLNYSLLLASVPVIFGLFTLISKNLPYVLDYSIKDSNGFVSSSNGNGHHEQKNETSLPFYLFFLGILIFGYNIFLRIFQPPFFISIIMPIILLLFFLKQNNSISNYF